MVAVHLGPSWFFGVDAILEAFASLIALFVALASWRVYRMTGGKKYGFFTVGMFLLMFSFVSRAVTDALIEGIFLKVPEQLVKYVFLVGYVAHIFLALTAYLLLIIITHKIVDKKVIALLFFLVVPSMLLSGSYYLSFYGLSAILLAFVALAYFQNYQKVCSLSACFVFSGFVLLTFAQLLFLAEILYKPLYAGAQIVQAFGYLLLLIALVKTLLK